MRKECTWTILDQFPAARRFLCHVPGEIQRQATAGKESFGFFERLCLLFKLDEQFGIGLAELRQERECLPIH